MWRAAPARAPLGKGPNAAAATSRAAATAHANRTRQELAASMRRPARSVGGSHSRALVEAASDAWGACEGEEGAARQVQGCVPVGAAWRGEVRGFAPGRVLELVRWLLVGGVSARASVARTGHTEA